MPISISAGKRSPVITYLLLLVLVTVLQFFLESGIVLSLSATYMLAVPFLLGKDQHLFSATFSGILKGLGITFAILVLYVLSYKLFAQFTGGVLGVRNFTYSFIVIQFLLVALPEEVFFRGYLQNEFGNNIRAIIIVSLLFSIAHLTTICIFGGAGGMTCAQNGLTFFPSLVMGYLYYKTGTVWASILFHFFANIVHILLVIR